MLTDKQAEAFLNIIPKEQVLLSFGNIANFIKGLDNISGNRFGLQFIQSEYHSGFEVAEIMFENQRYTLEFISQEELDIEEILSQVNQWLPKNYFFEVVQFENRLVAVYFLDVSMESKLIAAGLGNQLPLLYQRNAAEYYEEFSLFVNQYKAQMQRQEYLQAIQNISAAYHLIAEMNLDFGVDFEKFDRNQLCMDMALCYEQLDNGKEAEHWRKWAEEH